MQNGPRGREPLWAFRLIDKVAGMGILKRMRRAIRPDRSSIFSGNYPSFAEALADAGSAYEGPDVVEHAVAGYRSAIGEASPSNYRRVLPLLAALPVVGEVSRVVDFGGSCGEHYHRLRRAIPGFDPVWDIVETPSICAASPLMGADDRKRFVSSLDALEPGPVDLVVCSGTIHCIDDYRAAMTGLFDLGPRYVLFSRVPVWDRLEGHRIVIQRSPYLTQTAIAQRFFAPTFWDEVSAHGNIVFDFVLPEDGISFDGRQFVMSGCLVESGLSDRGTKN